MITYNLMLLVACHIVLIIGIAMIYHDVLIRVRRWRSLSAHVRRALHDTSAFGIGSVAARELRRRSYALAFDIGSVAAAAPRRRSHKSKQGGDSNGNSYQ